MRPHVRAAATILAGGNGHDISLMPMPLRADHAVVEAAVRQNGRALRHAPPALRADLRLLCLALRQIRSTEGGAVPDFLGFSLLRDVPAGLKADAAYMTGLSRACGWALRHAAPRLRDDNGVVLAAVGTDGLAIKHASARLRATVVVVVAAVVSAGDAKDSLGHDVLAHAGGVLSLLPCLCALAAVEGAGHRRAASNNPDFRRQMVLEKQIIARRLPGTLLGWRAVRAAAAAALQGTTAGYAAPLVVVGPQGRQWTVPPGWWRGNLRAAVRAVDPKLAAAAFTLVTGDGVEATASALLPGDVSPRVVFMSVKS